MVCGRVRKAILETRCLSLVAYRRECVRVVLSGRSSRWLFVDDSVGSQGSTDLLESSSVLRTPAMLDEQALHRLWAGSEQEAYHMSRRRRLVTVCAAAKELFPAMKRCVKLAS